MLAYAFTIETLSVPARKQFQQPALNSIEASQLASNRATSLLQPASCRQVIRPPLYYSQPVVDK